MWVSIIIFFSSIYRIFLGKTNRSLVVAREETACRIGMGRKAEIAHIVEDEQVLLVLGKRGHERRHAKIEFRASIDIPRGWVNPVGFKKSHEPQRRRICGAPR